VLGLQWALQTKIQLMTLFLNNFENTKFSFGTVAQLYHAALVKDSVVSIRQLVTITGTLDIG
jgi:hypothetical protein